MFLCNCLNHSLHACRSEPITDKHDRVIAVIVAPPECNDWDSVNDEASMLLEEARPECKFKSEEMTHRRGIYPAMGCGISLGNGQKKPMRLSLRNATNRKIFEKLFSSDAFQRIAGAQSGKCSIKPALILM